MKKIELIWREILTEALENHQSYFSQKELVESLNFLPVWSFMP